jgi:DNA invertase Pin-like site-specific DNA recombinase
MMNGFSAAGSQATNEKFKACIYVRVSTENQTVTYQLPALKNWVDHYSLDVIEVYAENESARKDGH